MGCGATKPTKLEARLSHSQAQQSQRQLDASVTQMQTTESIETDYIFHALDPIITQRNYIRKAVSKSNNAARIVKMYYCQNLTQSEKSELEKTITFLMKIKHLNLISTHAHYFHDNRLSLVMEYCDGGSMLTSLDKFSQLQQHMMMDVFLQIMAGVQYLHNEGVVHGNIKLEHIVFTNKSMETVKLIDFGISNALKAACCQWKANNTIQEISFKSPESLKPNGALTNKSDVWSCGCLLYFFLTSHMPFQARDIQSLRTSISRGVVNFEGSEWVNINPQMKELLLRMLSANPQKRPSAAEVINHPVFTNRAKIIMKPNKQLSKHMKDFKVHILIIKCQSQMQNAMLNYIAENMMSEQDKKRLMEEFQKFDLNKDGTLTKEELLKVYAATMSSEQAVQEVNQIFTKIDVNGSGKIDYQGIKLSNEEFVIATIDQKKYFNKEKLLLLFQQIDRDHSGQLSKQEVKKLLRDMQIPPEKLEKLQNQLDQDGDGQINQEEFLKIMQQIT